MNDLKTICVHCNSAVASGTCPYCGGPICDACLASVNASRRCQRMIKKVEAPAKKPTPMI